MTEKKLSPKHLTGINSDCEGIVPWYQAEVDMLIKSMADEMDKTIINLALKGGSYNADRCRNNRCHDGRS